MCQGLGVGVVHLHQVHRWKMSHAGIPSPYLQSNRRRSRGGAAHILQSTLIYLSTERNKFINTTYITYVTCSHKS